MVLTLFVYIYLSYLKLTYPLKLDGVRRRSFPFGFASGQVRTVSFGGEHLPESQGSPSEIDGAGGIEVVLDRLRLDGVTKEQPVSSLSGGEKAPWRSGT